MKKRKILSFLLLFLVIFVFNPNFSLAQDFLTDLQRDFSPIQGFIIGIEDGLYLIDKGKAQGVKPKDIFLVYKRTKKIIHPETKESLGFLKDPIGKLEVVRVEENFSLARSLVKKEEFPIPTLVRRNAELKILVLSEAPGSEEPIIFALKNILPESELKLLRDLTFSQIDPTYLSTQRVDFLMVTGPGYVKVYNSYLEPIKSYGTLLAFPKKEEVKSAPRPQPSPTFSQPTRAIPFSQVQVLGKMPGEVLQAEFADLDGDGTPELIYFSQEELQIVKIKGGLLARYKPSKGRPIYLSIGPKGWIALTIYEPNVKLRSEVLRFTSRGLERIIKEVNLFLHFVDYAGTGERDTLLGQTFSLETFFGKEVYILKREGDKIVYGPKLEVADNFILPGSILADLDGDGEREWITYLPDGRLGVYRRNLLLFSTAFPVGKHFHSEILTAGKKGQEVLKGIFHPYPTPILTNSPLDGRPAVLYLKTDFPLEKIARDLKSIPLSQATFQVQLLGYQGTYFFRNLTEPETGIPTGIGLWEGFLYLTKVLGEYPGKTSSELSYRW